MPCASCDPTSSNNNPCRFDSVPDCGPNAAPVCSYIDKQYYCQPNGANLLHAAYIDATARAGGYN